MLDAMRRWSGAYLTSLPDFVCTRTVRQFRNYTLVRHPSFSQRDRMEPVADDRWHAAGGYSGEAGYVGGRDYYRVAFIDNKPFRGSFEQLGRDVLSGEFGGLMTEILDPSREATIEWDHWEVYRARRMAVLRYAVDLKHSRYWLRSPATQPSGATQVTVGQGASSPNGARGYRFARSVIPSALNRTWQATATRNSVARMAYSR